MTQEEKQLLLQDLCARLPYGVKYQDRIEGGIHILSLGIIHHYERFIPYLRPMSSMTEEEKEELSKVALVDNEGTVSDIPEYVDWLNAHHFDYRGLIERGLALKAPEGMYNLNSK